MGARYRHLLALFFVLLVLGLVSTPLQAPKLPKHALLSPLHNAEVHGNRLPQADEPASPALLAQVQEYLHGYWDAAKNAMKDLYHKSYLPSVDEKVRDMYSKGTTAMSTYTGIFTDQLLSMLKGD
ncbi:apolipoprotein C-II [Trichechus inunguis]